MAANSQAALAPCDSLKRAKLFLVGGLVVYKIQAKPAHYLIWSFSSLVGDFVAPDELGQEYG